ncbi:MAG: hypothetical protein ACOYI5_05900 [Christensenellales bacterium]|jgi:hypothetical protein
MRKLWQAWLRAYRAQKGLTITYLVLRALALLVAIASVWLGNYENALTCLLALLMFMLPLIAEKTLRIEIPSPLEITILAMIFGALVLGEVSSYYVRVPHWDSLLHAINGFICAAIGYSLLDIMNRTKSFSMQVSTLYMAIMAFCFSMTIGVLWEFFEFTVDYFFQKDMQKDTVLNAIHTVSLDPENLNRVFSIRGIEEVFINGEPLGLGGYLDIGLYDTMKDLFTNCIGALAFSVVGYHYGRAPVPPRIVSGFIPYAVKDTCEVPKPRDDSAK